MPLSHFGLLRPPVRFVPIRVEPDEMEREVARQSVLGRYIQHSGDLTQHGFAIVLVLVAFDHHHSVELVNGEVEPSELLRPLSTKRDHGFAIGGVPDGGEVLVELLIPFLPPLVGPLGMVPFDVPGQIVCLDVAGFTTLRGAHVRAIVVVDHSVMFQIRRCTE